MGKLRMFLAVILFIASLSLADKALLFKNKIDTDLLDAWNREIELIKSECKTTLLPSNFVVEFGETDDAIGYCQHYSNGFKIVLNANYWYLRLDDVGKRQLLLHEMMHCVLNVRHNTTDPNNFMYPEYTRIDEDTLMNQVKVVIKESRKCT